jgi:hypothetical protein
MFVTVLTVEVSSVEISSIEFSPSMMDESDFQKSKG